MSVKHILDIAFDRLRQSAKTPKESSTLVGVTVAVAIVSLGVAAAAAQAQGVGRPETPQTADFVSGAPQPVVLQERTVWKGADLDGDGQADLANPTGQAPRTEDAYGEGRFHAGRDGGARRHEGVDYVATPGQDVEAPISGYVARIGYAYPGDPRLRYVEIENPALHMTARAFYVDPSVQVGDSVALGLPIGHAQSLQRRYPRGITNHVHLELEDRRGRKLDAERLIIARAELGPVAAD